MQEFEIENGVLKKYNGNGSRVVIPFGVKEIGEKAFYRCTSITSVIIPNGVESIGMMAFACDQDFNTKYSNSSFYKYSNLTTIVISPSVKFIDAGAFAYCYKLKYVCISDLAAWCNIRFRNIARIGATNPIEHTGSLYLNNRLITDLKIPEGVSEIKDHAFYGGTSIQSVSLPKSLRRIGNSAFNCTSIRSISIPESVSIVGYCAFANCESLKTIYCGHKKPFIGLPFGFDKDWLGKDERHGIYYTKKCVAQVVWNCKR